MLGSRSRAPIILCIAVLDLGLLALLLAGGTTGATVLAIGGHFALTVAIWRTLTAGSRRVLATAWMVSLPGIGLLVALATMDHRGTGDLQQFQRGQVAERVVGPAKVVRALAGHVPVCELLVSGVSRTRRAALATLASRRDAESIEVLRWAVRHDDGDLALDAALTLEELTDVYEAQREDAREQFSELPCFKTAVIAGDVVLDALWSHLVDDAMIPALTQEARAAYMRAVELEPTRAAELIERRAKVALVGLRPAEALAILTPALQLPGASPALKALHNQAIIASRLFTRHAEQAVDGAG